MDEYDMMGFFVLVAIFVFGIMCGLLLALI